MTGNPIAPWTADAWAKGVTNFDLATAYAASRKIPSKAPGCPGVAGQRVRWTNFLPNTATCPRCIRTKPKTVDRVHPRERRQAISVTEAQSYDDWCTAQIARSLGNEADYQFFPETRRQLQKSLSPGQRPRLAQGRQTAIGSNPFDPGWSGGQGGAITPRKTTATRMIGMCSTNLPGLFELMGGRTNAEAKLDQFFREGLGPQQIRFLV